MALYWDRVCFISVVMSAVAGLLTEPPGLATRAGAGAGTAIGDRPER